jgi:hypothetical protein
VCIWGHLCAEYDMIPSQHELTSSVRQLSEIRELEFVLLSCLCKV